MSSSTARPTRAPARILHHARRHAGLTQRALSAVSGVPQETIARIEASTTQPRFDTLACLLAACGAELEAVPRLGDGVDRTLIQSALALDPAGRLERGQQAAQGMESLQEAWMRSRAARGQ